MKTKEKILYALLDLSATKGLGRVSMNDIAASLNIKKPSIYAHYKSKEEIIDMMFKTIMASSKQLLNINDLSAYVERFPFEAILYHALDIYLKWLSDDNVSKLYRIIQMEKMVDSQVAKLSDELTNDMLEYIGAVLMLCEQAGKCTIKDPLFAAKLLVYYFEKLVVDMYISNINIEKQLYILCSKFKTIYEHGDL